MTATDAAAGSASSSFSSLNPGSAGAWRVRKPDGAVLIAEEFTTLRTWIVDRTVRREDEVSRSGRSWKRLGDIAELASFFDVVDAAEAAARAQLVAEGTLPPLPAAEAPRAAAPPAASRASAPRRWAPRVAAAAAVGLALVAGFVVLASREDSAPGAEPGPRPDQAAIAMARAAVQQDRRQPIDAARAALAALAPSAPILAWQARLDVALAAHAREEARLLDTHVLLLQRQQAGEGGASPVPPPASSHSAGAVAPTEPARSAEQELARRRRDDATSLLATAYAALARARGEGRRLADVHLASAAYQLEKGAWSELRADLEHAEDAAREDPEAQEELALLQILAEAAIGMRDDPRQALARVPSSLSDGRVQMVRAALAVTSLVRAGDAGAAPAAARDEARTLVESLPRPDTRADLLRQIMERVDLLAEAEEVQLGVATEADSNAGLEGLSYDMLMQRAERAMLNDHAREAWELFSHAARRRPGAPRPWLQAGWAALDLDRKGDATAAFKKAIALDDELAEAWFGLAEVSHFSGRIEEARGAYHRYLQLDPGGKDAAVARRALDALQ